MFPKNKTLIGTLRIKGATDSTPALRLSLSSMLGSADLLPKGISPSAILIVRNLADPLPGHLKSRGVTVDPGWERAVQDALTGMYQTAARPVTGYIPQDAKAVLFADEGEMLACLALDMSRKEAAGRWWWKAILKRFPSGDLSNLLSSRANFVPAVLHHLAEWGLAVTVVSALSREEVMTVIAALNRVYGLQEPESSRTDASPLPRFDTTQEAEPPWKRWYLSAPHLSKEGEYLLGLGLCLYHEPAAVKTPAFLRDLSNWLVYRDSASAVRDRFPEDQLSRSRSGTDRKDTGVRKTEREKEDVPARSAAKELVPLPSSFQRDSASAGTGDLSEDKPSPIRMSGTNREDDAVRKMEREKADLPARSAAKEPDKVPPTASFQKSTSTRRDDLPEDKISPIRITGSDHEDAAIRKTELEKADVPARSTAKEPDKVAPPVFFRRMYGPGYKDTAGYIPDDAEEKALESVETIRKKADDVKERSPESVELTGNTTDTGLQAKVLTGLEKKPQFKPGIAGTIPEEGIFTRLGGVLYLINVMRHLALPACFEEEWGLASQLGSWGVLEVLARVLAGDDDLSHDLLWNVLAELGGRDPGELPGETFCGSESFHLPASWFTGDELMYFRATDRQRLRLWSENCLLVDCPESAPLVQARNELGRYLDKGDSIELSGRPFDHAPVENINSPMTEGLNPDLKRWLSMVMPSIRYRLRCALGPVTSEDPEREILHVPGRLYATSTHVDLVMSMDDISMPVRLAGLDRDPGWLSDFGRVVQFHFE